MTIIGRQFPFRRPGGPRITARGTPPSLPEMPDAPGPPCRGPVSGILQHFAMPQESRQRQRAILRAALSRKERAIPRPRGWRQRRSYRARDRSTARHLGPTSLSQIFADRKWHSRKHSSPIGLVAANKENGLGRSRAPPRSCRRCRASSMILTAGRCFPGLGRNSAATMAIVFEATRASARGPGCRATAESLKRERRTRADRAPALRFPNESYFAAARSSSASMGIA